MLRILRSKGKTPYETPEAFAIANIRKQSPIGIVVKVVGVSSAWNDKYKEAIGMLLPVEKIAELLDRSFLNEKVYIVKVSHKLGGRWHEKYVKEV